MPDPALRVSLLALSSLVTRLNDLLEQTQLYGPADALRDTARVMGLQVAALLRAEAPPADDPLPDAEHVLDFARASGLGAAERPEKPEGWALEISLSHYHDGTLDNQQSHYSGSFSEAVAAAGYRQLDALFERICESRALPPAPSARPQEYPPTACQAECNPFTATCGAQFCSYEAMADHNKHCPVAAPARSPEDSK